MVKTPLKDAPPPMDDAPPFVETLLHSNLETAPKDGRWIEMTEDGTIWVPVRFYQTRLRAAGSIAWVKAECWSTSNPSKLAHRLDKPIAWREASRA